jgi:hypothetical protein
VAAPYSINSGDIVQFTVWQRLFGQTVLNRMHYQVNGPTQLNGPAELQIFLGNAAAGSNWPSIVRQRQSHDLKVEKFSAQKISTTRWAAEWAVANTEGGNAGASLPSNVNIVFQKHVPQASRRGLQGRMHVAGIPSDNFLGDNLTNAAYLVWNSTCITFLTQIAGGTGVFYTPVIWSNAGGVRHVAELDKVSVSTEARIMRRRTVGLGI